MKIFDTVYISIPGLSCNGELGQIINKSEYRGEYTYLVVFNGRESISWFPEFCLTIVDSLFE